MPVPPPAVEIIRFGVFEFDLNGLQLYNAVVRIKLQEQPFRVLAFLVQRAGEVVTRDELRQRIWPTDVYGTFHQGLNNAIRKVRETLGDSAYNPPFVETIAKHGYQFIAPVSKEPRPP